jgi:hypothetical protein
MNDNMIFGLVFLTLGIFIVPLTRDENGAETDGTK